MEMDFLVAILMMSTKRYVQATEMLRKIQNTFYLKPIDELMKN
jgi:hypothetical protein